MINPFTEVNWIPGQAEKRKFALSLVIGFPCLAAAMLLVRRVVSGAWHIESAFMLGGIGLSVGVILFALPGIAKPFYLAWYFAACCIGIVLGNVLFSAFFYALVTPVGLLLRAFGRNAIEKGFSQRETYWHEVYETWDPKRYYSQF